MRRGEAGALPQHLELLLPSFSLTNTAWARLNQAPLSLLRHLSTCIHKITERNGASTQAASDIRGPM